MAWKPTSHGLPPLDPVSSLRSIASRVRSLAARKRPAQYRPTLDRGPLIHPAQGREAVINAAGVRQQPADQVLRARGRTHRREPPRARIETLKAFEMDSHTRVELRLNHRRPHMEGHVRIGDRDVADRVEPLASEVEFARDVVVRESG
jgi:hypothetical protein